MSGIFASIKVTGKPRCARCKRPFTPKGDEIWGPKCARKMHAQLTDLSALDHLDTTDAEGEPGAQTERACRVCGCTDFTPCPGGCAWVKPDLCSSCASAEVRIKTDTGNRCRRCGTSISEDPCALYCSECEDETGIHDTLISRHTVIV